MSRIGNLGDGPLRLELLDQSLCSEPLPLARLSVWVLKDVKYSLQQGLW